MKKPKLVVTTSASGLQRRKHGRIRINTESYFLFKDKKYETTILDIGTGGAALLSAIPLYKGELIHLYVNLGGEELIIEGNITRTSGKIFVLKFNDLNEVIAGKIQLFINLKVYGKWLLKMNYMKQL